MRPSVLQGCRFSVIFHYFWPNPFSIFSYFIFLFLNFLSLFVFIFCETARTCIFAKVQWHPWSCLAETSTLDIKGKRDQRCVAQPGEYESVLGSDIATLVKWLLLARNVGQCEMGRWVARKGPLRSKEDGGCVLPDFVQLIHDYLFSYKLFFFLFCWQTKHVKL